MTYYIEPICQGLVKIHEETVSYLIDLATAEANLETVKASRAKYADDDCYLRRLNFYEDVLAVFTNEKRS